MSLWQWKTFFCGNSEDIFSVITHSSLYSFVTPSQICFGVLILVCWFWKHARFTSPPTQKVFLCQPFIKGMGTRLTGYHLGLKNTPRHIGRVKHWNQDFSCSSWLIVLLLHVMKLVLKIHIQSENNIRQFKTLHTFKMEILTYFPDSYNRKKVRLTIIRVHIWTKKENMFPDSY